MKTVESHIRIARQFIMRYARPVFGGSELIRIKRSDIERMACAIAEGVKKELHEEDMRRAAIAEQEFYREQRSMPRDT
jgi:hypothetical protein